MKNIKFGHSLSFYIHIKIISSVKIKKILGISTAIRVFESPLLCIWQFECSVHIFRGPCLTADTSREKGVNNISQLRSPAFCSNPCTMGSKNKGVTFTCLFVCLFDPEVSFRPSCIFKCPYRSYSEEERSQQHLSAQVTRFLLKLMHNGVQKLGSYIHMFVCLIWSVIMSPQGDLHSMGWRQMRVSSGGER